MRRFICLALLALIVNTCPSGAQCPSNKGQIEVAASYGTITGDQFSDQVSNDKSKKLTYNSGNTFLTLRYFFFSCLSLGVSGGITNVKGEYADPYNPSAVSSTYKQSISTLAVEVYYVYTFRKYLEIYTFLGAGPEFTTASNTSYPVANPMGITTTEGRDAFKVQFTPLGIRCGGKFGGFAELGIGYKGLLNAGISYRFGRPCWWKL